MSVKLGMFMMPFHHPSRNYATTLEEDREAIIVADRLGFSDVFVGEHFTSWSEPISSPLMFVSTVIDRTQKIRFGTGVLNLPQTHPLVVAAQTAMFDHLQSTQHADGSWPASSGLGVGRLYATALWCTLLQLDRGTHPLQRMTSTFNVN